MSKEENKDEGLKKEIGLRFKEFRQAIKKNRDELENELKVCQGTIASIETGISFPGINFQNYLYWQYQLNINWLLTGKEDMLISPAEKKKHNDLPLLFWHIDESDPRFEGYVELFTLMRIPVIEQVILSKLEELKALSKEEIKSFFEEA